MGRLSFFVPVLVMLALMATALPAAARSDIVTGASDPAGSGPDVAQVQVTVEAFKAKTGKYPRTWSLWSKWGARGGETDCVRGKGTCAFPKAAVKWLHSKNITPIIWWIPTWPGNWEQGKYERYKRILYGKHDQYITRWAKDLRKVTNLTNKPVIIRWAHESLGNWFPWSVQNFDNSKDNYKRAFRYLYNKFKRLGALRKGRFMWAQVSANPSGYPGDAYVHFVGITILNFGGDKWRDPKDIVDLKAGKARQLTKKPVIFVEAASGPAPGPGGETKAKWITQAYNRAYYKHPNVRGIIYLDALVKHHPDWRLIKPDDLSALQAYKDLSAQSRFRGKFK